MATAGLWLGWINIILCVIVGILIILLIVGLIAGFSGLGPLSDWLNSFGY